jgi:hypothetical protein
MAKAYDWKEEDKKEPASKVAKDDGEVSRLDVELVENGLQVSVTYEPRPEKAGKKRGDDEISTTIGVCCSKRYVFSDKAQAVKFIASKLS